MKQHTQLFTGKNGSCVATCVACILDLELSEVPHFTAFVRWMEAMDLWCWQHGLVWHQSIGDAADDGPPRCWIPHRIDSDDQRVLRDRCHLPRPSTGLAIAGGESPRLDEDGMPMGHAVVWDLDADRMAWDPHPDRTGIVGRPVRWYWFTKKEPA